VVNGRAKSPLIVEDGERDQRETGAAVPLCECTVPSGVAAAVSSAGEKPR
jgi:hypothetical protein